MSYTVHWRLDDGRVEDDEFVAGVTYTIPTGATGISVAAKDPEPRPGPCSSDPGTIVTAYPMAWCILTEGHTGDHVSSDGMRWRMRAEPGS